jgi:hypothetical protein
LYKRNGFSVLHITFNDIKPIGFVKWDDWRDLKFIQNPKKWINNSDPRNNYSGGMWIFDSDIPYLSFY